MPWNAIWPVITDSVKTNGPTGQQNTEYIADTMGDVALNINLNSTTDHFWNIDAGLNGHHRFVKLPDYAGEPLFDPTFIKGVIYSKTVSVSNTRVEMFYENEQGTYQVSPSYQTGTFNVTNAFTNIVTIPANVYGHIFFTKDSDPSLCCEAIISSGAAIARGFTSRVRSNNTNATGPVTLDEYAIELRNTGADGLSLFGKRGDGNGSTDGNWSWKLTYRAI